MKQRQAQGVVDGLARWMGIRAPAVRLKKLKRPGWSGRYHPNSVKISVRYGRDRNGPDLEKPLIGHEFAHGATREIYCGGQGKKATKGCSYRGQHDKRFYGVLNKIHKKLGTSREKAKMLESKAGYNPPHDWLDHSSSRKGKTMRRSPRTTKPIKRRSSKSFWDRITDGVSKISKRIVDSADTRSRSMRARARRHGATEISGRSFADFQVKLARTLENKYKFSRGAAFAVAHGPKTMEVFRRGYSPQFVASTVAHHRSSKRGFDGARAHTRARVRPKLWMKKATRHPGRLRKLLGMRKGETIPYEWKDQGCKEPRKTFAKLLGRIPSGPEGRSFLKMMCLARTYAERGGRKRKVITRRAA
jgi:hypothetical protein